MSTMRRAGRRRHFVDLQQVTARTKTSTGFVDTWGTYARVWAAVVPFEASPSERPVAETVQAPVSHLVELDYRADLTTKHRVLFGTRTLYIIGLQNVDERNKTHVLQCEERAA